MVTVSRATLERLLRDEVKRVWDRLSATIPSQARIENWPQGDSVWFCLLLLWGLSPGSNLQLTMPANVVVLRNGLESGEGLVICADPGSDLLVAVTTCFCLVCV